MLTSIPNNKSSIIWKVSQLIILATKRLYLASWLANSIADIHVDDNSKLITEYYNTRTYIRKSILDRLLPRCEEIDLYLTQKNAIKRIIPNLKDVFFLSNNLSNLISLTLLINSEIDHNNKNKILYNVNFKKVLV